MNHSRQVGLEIIEGHDRFSKWFLRFADQTVESKMYHFLSKKIAFDADLLKLAESANSKQPVPNLLFASVNYLLYKNPTAPLAQFYPNHSGQPFKEDGLFELFKQFCFSNETQIVKLMQTKLVQTNEARRCANLLPALISVSNQIESDIALIDVGASSGINLLLDTYSYHYSNGIRFEGSDSEVHLTCDCSGPFPPVVRFPKISQRIGIDLNPLNLQDQDEIFWTLSLVWPDQLERVATLKRALENLKRHPVKMIKGSVVDQLEPVVSKVPENQVVCIMHSYMMNQLSTEDKSQMEQIFLKLSQLRDIWRISLEWLDSPDPVLTLTHYVSGSIRHTQRLATCHQHGASMVFENSTDGEAK